MQSTSAPRRWWKTPAYWNARGRLQRMLSPDSARCAERHCRDDSTIEQKITALKSKIDDASASIASGPINTNRLKQQKVQWAAELAELMKQTPEAVAEQAKAKQLEEQKIKVNAAYDSLISSQRTKPAMAR